LDFIRTILTKPTFNLVSSRVRHDVVTDYMELKCKAPMIKCHIIGTKFRKNQYTDSKVQMTE